MQEQRMIEENNEKILILDFGSQYAQLIARRVRENNVFSEIVSHKITAEEIRKIHPKGIILSGGPASVYVKNAPQCDEKIVKLGIPVLGICYGMQLGCQMLGATVKPTTTREYGRTTCTVNDGDRLFKSLTKDITVWMSHGDQIVELPPEFESLAFTHNCPFAAAGHKQSAFYGVQFHPEVTHTAHGNQIIRNFLYEICKCTGNWKMHSYIKKSVDDIRNQVGGGRVVCGLSGGVDSAVTAALIHKSIGNRLSCIFVDNGLLRNYEAEEVVETFKNTFTVDLHTIHAQDRFLMKLKGVTDPEKKRKIIGHEFIEIFKEEAKKISEVKFLAQGTLYPDVIESIPAHGGPTVTIKSHHNVGGLPEELGFELVEPLRFLFKDEVRRIGEELGLPEDLVWRHPFPGPGLAIRIIGEITIPRLEILRNADKILIEEIRKAGLYRSISQCFAVLLPVSTVGVMGDERSYENIIAIRAVETTDFMTADWYHIPHEILGVISSRLINEVKGVNRVVYDISTKPPSTIEWE
jgi:GMP synthase (glutamine-hydrolysing)